MNVRIGILLFLTATALCARDSQMEPGPTAFSIRVPSFHLQHATVFDGVAELTTIQSDLSFSFEEPLKAKFTDPPIPQAFFDLTLESRTIGEILDALCGKDTTYTWSRDGMMVNVFPRSVLSNSSYLLNRQVLPFQMQGATQPEQAVFAIVAHLAPPFEQIACAQIGGDTSYSAPLSSTFRGLTVRQAFNLTAIQLGPRGGWVFGGSQEFRTIGFHKETIHYSSKTETGRPDRK